MKSQGRPVGGSDKQVHVRYVPVHVGPLLSVNKQTSSATPRFQGSEMVQEPQQPETLATGIGFRADFATVATGSTHAPLIGSLICCQPHRSPYYHCFGGSLNAL